MTINCTKLNKPVHRLEDFLESYSAAVTTSLHDSKDSYQLSLLHLRAVASFSRQAALEAERVDDASKLPDELEVLGVVVKPTDTLKVPTPARFSRKFSLHLYRTSRAHTHVCSMHTHTCVVLSQCLLHDLECFVFAHSIFKPLRPSRTR